MGLSVHLDLAMKFLALALIVASASAKNLRFNLLAPPTELEYGFCDGSPEPLTFDVMSVTPFPILVQNGATITLEIQITINQEVPVGSVVDLNLVLEGLIPIKIPCLEIEGLHIGPATMTVTSFSPPHLTSSAPPMSLRARLAPFPLEPESMVVETP